MSLIRHFKAIATWGFILSLAMSIPCRAEGAPDSDEREIIGSYNTTGLQLYEKLKEASQNLVISPYSIGTAMAMVFSGAREDTAMEMKTVLHMNVPGERMDSANERIIEKINRYQKEKDVMLSTANALCLTPDSALVHHSYQTLLNMKYRAELFRAQTVAPINAWVEKKTHGKIDRILEGLSANSVCVILNAIYFKGFWASQFDRKLTRPGKFHTIENKTLSVPMMHQTAKYPVVVQDNFMAIEMPYKTDPLSMVIFLPKERNGLAGIEQKISMAMVRSVLCDFEKNKPEKVMLTLPKFRIEFGSGLKSAFQTLGMKLAFSDQADFGGITGRENTPGLIWIGQIQHKAFIEINEEGSEAAAATGVEFITKSISPKITRFNVDHPFLFLLMDKTTGAILFMGRVNNPLES